MALTPQTYRMLWLFAIVVRIALTATTLGTNDSVYTTTWVDIVNRVGIAKSYEATPMMNHPPLSLATMVLFDRIGSLFRIAFIDVLRGAQIVADCLTAFALYRIGMQESVEHARNLASFVLLSPAAAFVSGFHCNTDPTMTALIMLAASFVVVEKPRPVAAGITLALAAGIKIVPFVLAPLFFFFIAREKRMRFAIAFALVAAIIFVPAIVAGGATVVRHIFGYAGGIPFEWGIPGVAYAIWRNVPPLQGAAQGVMEGWAAFGRYIVYAAMLLVVSAVAVRRPAARTGLLHAVGIMLMTMLVLAPGFGVQYVAWIIPLLPFAISWRFALAVNAALSIYLFITYTVWSGEWPWWYAHMGTTGPYRWMGAVAGYVMWAILAAALAVAVRRYAMLSRNGLVRA